MVWERRSTDSGHKPLPWDRQDMGYTEMLSIQCDDMTAANIVIDDATEIAMSVEDWEIAGRPTIGDTISFEVIGDGMFVDAFKGIRYLVTDEYEHDGSHIVSFAEIPSEDADSGNANWSDLPLDSGDDDDFDFAEYDGGSMDTLRLFPGIVAPKMDETAADDRSHDSQDETDHRVAIRSMPSMRLLGTLVNEHGMSVHDVVAGLVAFENESAVPVTNEDVIVDFFRQKSDDIRGISEDFEAYSKQIAERRNENRDDGLLGNTQSIRTS